MAASLPAAELDQTMARLLEEERITGAVYALVDGDDTRTGAAGLAHWPSRTPMPDTARVNIGSVTKTLLALGVLRLVSEGRLDLDTPVRHWLPDVPIDGPPQRPVTLRHLLDHTAGLDDLRLWQFFTLRGDPHSPLSATFERPDNLLRLRSEPGDRFSYSNMSYTLAARVIEAQTGERYEAWLDRELLQPLGMLDSTFEFTSQEGEAPDTRMAWGHHDDFTPAAAFPTWLRPATQFTTTAADMARLMRFLMGDGRITGAKFVDPVLLAQMGRPTSTAAARAGLSVGYALGLALHDRHGAVGFCHLGNSVGYRAAMCLFPEAYQAYFIAHNTDSETARYERFDEALIAELGVWTPPAGTLGTIAPAQATGRYARTPARIDMFRYTDLLLGTVTLEAAGDKLVLRRWGRAPRELTPVGNHLYRATGRQLASHVLMPTADGLVLSDGLATFERVSATRFWGHWLSAAVGAAGLLALLALIPWQAWHDRAGWMSPAALAWILLLLPIPAAALQPFVALGDLTPASALLFIATAALPLLMVAHLWWSVRKRARLPAWRWQAISAVMVLQWCAALMAWDLLPFASWR